MAEKYLKIIQNGNVSFVPDARSTRQFWDAQNRLYAKSREAEKHIVTYTVAKDEEVAHLLPQPVLQAVPASNEMQSLKEKIAAQQAQIEFLIKIASGNKPDDDVKERQKPGPKPKSDGKAD